MGFLLFVVSSSLSVGQSMRDDILLRTLQIKVLHSESA